MKYTKFEEQLRDELYNSKEQVDVDELLDAIHGPAITSNRKRYLFGLLFVGLLISGAAYGWYSVEQNSMIMNSNMNISETQKTIIEKNTKLTSSSNTVAIASSNSSNVDGTINFQSSSSIDKKIDVKISNTANDNKNNKTNSEGRTIVNTSQKTYKTKPNSSLTSKNESITILENLEIDKVNDIDLLTSDVEVELLSDIDFLYPIIAKLDADIKITSLFVEPIKCFDFGVNTWTYDVLAEVGLLNPMKELAYTGTTDLELYNQRKDKEHSLEGLQAALYVKVSKKKIPFYLKLGASYTRLAEQVELTHMTTKTDTTQGIISITESQNGDTLTVIKGDIYTTTTTTHNNKKHHYFHLFDLPIGVGYNKRFNGFELGVEVGAQINLFTKVTGEWLEGVDDFKNVNNKKNFRPNVGLSYYAGIDISKEVSYYGSIYLSTRFRYLPNNFGSSDNVINQKYSLAGLHLGYKHRL